MAVSCFEPVAAFRAEPVALELLVFRFEPVVFRSDPVAFWVFGDAAISVLLPAAAASGRLAFLAVSGEVPELLPGRL